MRIKIGDKIYDSEKEPIMIILNEEDKKNIKNMSPDATKYCEYPSNDYWTENDYKRIHEWMDEIYEKGQKISILIPHKKT